MDRKRALIVMVSTVLAVLTVTAATATPRVSDTPLYAYRMEQASNEMNFLSTEMTDFTYIAEEGYVLSYEATGFCDPEPLAPTGEEIETCWPECTTTEYTCSSTCDSTCYTCYTCPENTCNNTCTSPYTCHLSTCVSTCNPTCTSPWTCQYSGCI